MLFRPDHITLATTRALWLPAIGAEHNILISSTTRNLILMDFPPLVHLVRSVPRQYVLFASILVFIDEFPLLQNGPSNDPHQILSCSSLPQWLDALPRCRFVRAIPTGCQPNLPAIKIPVDRMYTLVLSMQSKDECPMP